MSCRARARARERERERESAKFLKNAIQFHAWRASSHYFELTTPSHTCAYRIFLKSEIQNIAVGMDFHIHITVHTLNPKHVNLHFRKVLREISSLSFSQIILGHMILL